MKIRTYLSKSVAAAVMAIALNHTYIAQAYAMNTPACKAEPSVTIMHVSAASVQLDNESFTKARGRVGEKVVVGTVHITATDLPEGVAIVPSSKINGIFTTDVTTLPAGNSETDVTIYYEAVKIGSDEGKMYIMGDAGTYAEIKLGGLAVDPGNMPALSADPMQITDFETEVSNGVEKTISVHMTGFPSSVDVKVNQDKPGFTVNTSTLYYGVTDQKLRVTFFPKKAGTYEAVITLSNEFIEPVEIVVKGTATDKGADAGTEGDKLPLVYDNPLTTLDEHFGGVTHNKPLAIDGWKNLAALGQRAWWGYTFPDYDKDNAGEKVAKVTAYDSKMEPGQEEEFQMLLATPPLNLKDAASQLFTFRVMGKFMVENMTEQLSLCYLTYEDGQLMAYPVEEVAMPVLPDENGEWMEYQVDLTDLQLGDICHMGFLFTGLRGPEHSTTYFIDDVTFGRTDIPFIKTDVNEVTMESVDGALVVSDDVTVSTMGLTDDVHISLEGKYKDDFDVSHTTLPKEGGTFNMSYESNYKEGYYGVYAVLASEGAATKKVAFFATITSGIEAVEIGGNDVISIYSVNGTKLSAVKGIKAVEAVEALPAGIYVLQIKSAAGTRTLKIRR